MSLPFSTTNNLDEDNPSPCLSQTGYHNRDYNIDALFSMGGKTIRLVWQKLIVSWSDFLAINFILILRNCRSRDEGRELQISFELLGTGWYWKESDINVL